MNPSEDMRDPLEYPPTRPRLESLYEAELLSDGAYIRARRLFHDPATTARMVDLGILLLGVGLIIIGVLYFFAYNWAELGKWERFAAIGTLLLGSWGAAVRFELDDVRGKVALLASTLFVGVFLAVFGQIYQTGADAWQLFAAWSALTILWALLGRFQATWVLWLVVTNLAMGLAWRQESWLHDALPWEIAMVLMSLGHLGLLAAREKIKARVDWLELVWGRVALVSAVICWSTLPVLMTIVAGKSFLLGLGLVVGMLLLQVPLGWYALRRARDVVMLGLVGVSFIVVGITALGRVFLEELHEGGVLIMGVFTTVTFVGLIALLLRQWREWEASGAPRACGARAARSRRASAPSRWPPPSWRSSRDRSGSRSGPARRRSVRRGCAPRGPPRN